MVYIIVLSVLCIFGLFKDIKHFYLYLLFIGYACLEYTRLNSSLAYELNLPSLLYFILPFIAFLIILLTTKRRSGNE